MNKVILIVCASIILLSCTQNSNKPQEQTIKTDTEGTKEVPGWTPFETYLYNRNGYIYTNIKTNSDEDFIVWVSYKWIDSTKIPNGSRNIVETRECYSFDSRFLKIGDVAHYDYLKNGNAINTTEQTFPDWNYIIPCSEGDNIAQATIKILEKRYMFNKTANRLYRHEKYKTFPNDED